MSSALHLFSLLIPFFLPVSSPTVLDFPKRPPWNYQMTKEQLLAREEKCFRDYLEGIYSTYQPSQLSYFEHNLEVRGCRAQSVPK